MDHVIVLLVGLDGFVLLQFFVMTVPSDVIPKSTFETHLAVLGKNTCVSIVEVHNIAHRFPGNCCASSAH